MNWKRRSTLGWAIVLTACWNGSMVQAQTANWVGPVTGSPGWNTAANWSTSPVVPNAPGAVAVVNPAAASGNFLFIQIFAPTTVGDLAIGPSGTVGSVELATFGATAALNFDSGVAGQNAFFRKAPSSAARTSGVDLISGTVALTSSLSIIPSNGTGSSATNGGVLTLTGPITGAAGSGIRITGNFTGANNTTQALGTAVLANPNNSFSGPVILENGQLQVVGSVLAGVNGALGNSASPITVGTSNSVTADTSTLTLRFNTSGPSSNSTIDRGIDFSGLNTLPATGNSSGTTLRYAADTTLSSGTRQNTLTVAGPVTLSSTRNTVFWADRAGMTIDFTGSITGGSSTRALRLGAFTSNSGAELGGPGTYRFANQANDFNLTNLALVNGTLVIAGNVGLSTDPSPIGRNSAGGTASINLSDGNGGNIITSAGAGIIRSVFLETPGTFFSQAGGPSRDLNPGGGFQSNDTDYGEASATGGVNIINGFRFGGLNTSGEVTFNNAFNINRINAGGFTRTIPVAHNITLQASTGGIVNFNGYISSVAGTDTLAASPGTTSTLSTFRLVINQFLNHPSLDTDGNGVPDAAANAPVGAPTGGVVKLSNTTVGYLPTSTTEVRGGTLLVNGNHSRDASPGTIAVGGSIIVSSGATLGGFGTVRIGAPGSIVDVSGILDPGDPTPTATSLAGSLTINKPVVMRTGSTLAVDLNGPSNFVGSGVSLVGYDAIRLRNANTFTLEPGVTLLARVSYEPSINTFHAIVNTPTPGSIIGTFNGLDEGSLYTTAFGQIPVQFLVNYTNINGLQLISRSPVVSYVGPAEGAWTQTSNWSNPAGTAYSPDSPNITILLGSNVASPTVVTLDNAVRGTALRFDSTNSYTVSGAGSIELRTSPISTLLVSVPQGDHTLAVPLTLQANSGTQTGSNINVATGASLTLLGTVQSVPGTSIRTLISGELFAASSGTIALGSVVGSGSLVAATGTVTASGVQVAQLSVGSGALVNITGNRGVAVLSLLNIDSDGRLDLGTNNLVLRDGAGELATLQSRFTSGALYSSATLPNTGPYTTLGILVNAAAPGVPYFSSYDGVTGLADNDVIIKYTYAGDTNFDGILDGTDLSRVVEGFSTGSTGWQYGDVDNSGGPISLSDVLAFLNAYNYFLANNPPSLGNGTATPPGTAAIPEPSSLAILAAPVAMTLRRRRL